jgi:integrase
MRSRIVGDGTRKRKPPKPEKPYPSFPLTAHANGKWCKKVKGKLHYFGSWADPIGALNEWLADEHVIRSGGDRRADTGDHDILWLTNEFYAAKEQQRDNGDLSPRALRDYERSCEFIQEFFGKTRTLESIDAPDFARLRQSFPSTWNATTINNNIALIRAIFNFAFDAGGIDRPIRFGLNFKRVSKKRQRLERAKKPKKLFTATEIHQLIDKADFQLKAMILLGINCAYGNADVGRLEVPMIDFDRKWLEGLREKTAIERAAWLWPETIKAVNVAIENKYNNVPKSLADHVFVTKRRQCWHKEESNSSPLSAAFKKLTDKTGIYQKGVGFYALRHTFETVAGNARDQIAVNYVMGHCDDSMAEVYREGIDDKRIIDVCKFVRKWWRAGKEKPKRKAK